MVVSPQTAVIHHAITTLFLNCANDPEQLNTVLDIVNLDEDELFDAMETIASEYGFVLEE